ncbi:hypothetical protein WICMUC_002353 [Wickerhamomyces mucosus]|uniref:Uncharacterized protein n=1 Tax=Wickerhamomyces mucosus TaxID=1378264 RepID=A0A9P8TF42_9ASCO|nr:hypothetical protein WICMUC_002353 [Wickerhamomyces mucosus]
MVDPTIIKNVCDVFNFELPRLNLHTEVAPRTFRTIVMLDSMTLEENLNCFDHIKMPVQFHSHERFVFRTNNEIRYQFSDVISHYEQFNRVFQFYHEQIIVFLDVQFHAFLDRKTEPGFKLFLKNMRVINLEYSNSLNLLNYDTVLLDKLSFLLKKQDILRIKNKKEVEEIGEIVKKALITIDMIDVIDVDSALEDADSSDQEPNSSNIKKLKFDNKVKNAAFTAPAGFVPSQFTTSTLDEELHSKSVLTSDGLNWDSDPDASSITSQLKDKTDSIVSQPTVSVQRHLKNELKDFSISRGTRKELSCYILGMYPANLKLFGEKFTGTHTFNKFGIYVTTSPPEDRKGEFHIIPGVNSLFIQFTHKEQILKFLGYDPHQFEIAFVESEKNELALLNILNKKSKRVKIFIKTKQVDRVSPHWIWETDSTLKDISDQIAEF